MATGYFRWSSSRYSSATTNGSGCSPSGNAGVAVTWSGGHPDPFVVDQELEEKLGKDYPAPTYKPWLDVKL